MATARDLIVNSPTLQQLRDSDHLLRTLGTLALEGPGGEILPGRRKELALLAIVADRAPSAVRRADLAAHLWGEREETRARQSLRQALVNLRRALPDVVEVTPDTVRLAAPGVRLDARLFEEAVARGRPEEAVALWQGEFMPEADEIGAEPFRSWAEGKRARLEVLLHGALERWVGEAETAGDWVRAAARAAEWAERAPQDPRPRLRLVRSLLLGGRTEEAHAEHAGFTARMEEEGPAELPAEWWKLGEELAREERAPAPPRVQLGSAALFVPDLVGRGAAFAELHAAWETVRRGGSAAVIVSGEEGIGKTRLVQEFMRWLERSGEEAVVLHGRAFDSDRETPWSVSRDLLSPLRHAPGLAGCPASVLGELTRLVPSIRERFRELPAPTGDEAALQEAVRHAMGDVATEVPVVAVVDDLPHADPESLRLVLSVARHLPRAGALLLLTARTGDTAPSRSLDLRDVPDLRRIRLRHLTEPEVDAMLSSMMELPAGERTELAELLHAESGGNPLYVSELVLALVEEGYIETDEAGQWHAPELRGGRTLPLPTSVRELVARRLSHLDDASRELLGVAAALGERFDADRLEAVAGMPPETLASALDQLLIRRLIRELPGSPGSYAFTHKLTRRVAFDRLLPARRQELLRPAPEPRKPWYRHFWQAPDAASVDAGAEGEWLVARLRVLVMVLLLFVPIGNILSDPRSPTYRTGLAITLVALALSVALYVRLRRGGYRPWQGFASSIVDVSLIGAALFGFALAGDPHAAVNSKPTFEIYFLAILGASLRYDRRICLAAGAVAIAQYLGILLYVTSRWDLNDPSFAPFGYGMFSWVPQIGRLVLMAAATFLAWEVVRRAQHLRHLATFDRITGLVNHEFFGQRAEVELARARRSGREVAVAVVALASFRTLNEGLGRTAGDRALGIVAERLRTVAREEDVVARYRGGKFVLLLPDLSHERASAVVDAVRDELSRSPAALGAGLRPVRLELVAGTASYPADGSDLEALVRVADQRARQRSRNGAARDDERSTGSSRLKAG